VPRFVKCSEINFISKKSDVGWPHPKDVTILRKHFNQYFTEVIPGKKVYISRIGDSRSPLFEIELIRLLKERGWVVLDTSGMSLAHQIKEISSAEVLAGIHGAGLSGVNWMSSGTKLIEIASDKNIRCFQRLAILNDVDYFRFNFKNDLEGLNIVICELKNMGHI
jgi:capsular polysaccharide biosynthesis protein